MLKPFLKHSAIYITVGIATKFLFFILWIILGWWLQPEKIGEYTLLLFVIEFFAAIIIFGLDGGIMRFYHSKYSSDALPNILAIFSFSTILLLPLFIIFKNLLLHFLPGLSLIINSHQILISATIGTTALANLVGVHYTAKKNALLYTKLQLIQTLLLFGISLVLVYFGKGVIGLLWAKCISAFIVITITFTIEKVRIKLSSLSLPLIKNILSYSTPIMLQTVIGTLMLYFGRLLIERYNSLTELGIYSFFLMLTSQLNQLLSYANQAWTPKIFSDLESSQKQKVYAEIQFMTYCFSFLYLTFILVTILLGEGGIFTLLFKEVYRQNLHILYILLLFPLFSGVHTVLYPLYYYQDKTKKILGLSLVISAINLLATFVLVRLFNQTGAAYAVVFVSIVVLFTYLLVFKKSMEIPPSILRLGLVLTIIATFASTMLFITNSTMLFAVILLVGLFYTYLAGNLMQRQHILVALIKERINKKKIAKS